MHPQDVIFTLNYQVLWVGHISTWVPMQEMENLLCEGTLVGKNHSPGQAAHVPTIAAASATNVSGAPTAPPSSNASVRQCSQSPDIAVALGWVDTLYASGFGCDTTQGGTKQSGDEGCPTTNGVGARRRDYAHSTCARRAITSDAKRNIKDDGVHSRQGDVAATIVVVDANGGGDGGHDAPHSNATACNEVDEKTEDDTYAGVEKTPPLTEYEELREKHVALVRAAAKAAISCASDL